jgi:hypothetical protein
LFVVLCPSDGRSARQPFSPNAARFVVSIAAVFLLTTDAIEPSLVKRGSRIEGLNSVIGIRWHNKDMFSLHGEFSHAMYDGATVAPKPTKRRNFHRASRETVVSREKESQQVKTKTMQL